MTEFVEFH